MGDAVFWVNIDDNHNYQEKTEHCGSIIIGNVEKWGANLWVRERSYL